MSISKICLIASENNYPAFDSLRSILREILGSEQIVELRNKDLMVRKPILLKFLLFLLQDLILYLRILSHYKKDKINCILIFQGYYPLTCIGLRFLNIKLFLYIGGSSYKSRFFAISSFTEKILAHFNFILQKICHTFSDIIILPSMNMTKWLNLKEYKEKVRSAICIINSTFFNKFDVEISYEKRQNIIGYVGALTINKGILNLIKIVPIIKSKHDKELPKFMIIGDGPLIDHLRTEINNSETTKNFTLVGSLPNSVLHYYYNKMRFLVLPSFSEGLPSVILEAMACGTPVLATPVGAIPDIIKDGETGFLLKTNDPKHIAERIIELLDKPEALEKVSINAYRYVKKNFSYEKTLEAWQKIFIELGMHN